MERWCEVQALQIRHEQNKNETLRIDFIPIGANRFESYTPTDLKFLEIDGDIIINGGKLVGDIGK